jgi:hypothetical protein
MTTSLTNGPNYKKCARIIHSEINLQFVIKALAVKINHTTSENKDMRADKLYQETSWADKLYQEISEGGRPHKDTKDTTL